MKLQTQIGLSPEKNPIDYQSHAVLFGSCFATHMGRKLEYYKFNSFQNPFGILFHPGAIENLITRSVQGDPYDDTALFHQNERWHCFDAHSDLSQTSREGLLQHLNAQLTQTKKQLEQASHIFITLGTAWGYRYKATKALVANCHKVPQNEFNKELASPESVLKSLEKMVGLVRSVNKKTSIIFNVSPVRHLKDGFAENQLSKAHLITAIHGCISHLKDQHLAYFPSYELMMDELRDYRFYASDMVHPNELAIDYIWEKFKGVWISKNSYGTMERVEHIQKGIAHKPFNAESRQHKQFVNSIREKMRELQKEYPHMSFTESF